MKLLKEQGAELAYSDPYIPRLHRMRGYDFSYMSSVALSETTLSNFDLALITTDHTNVDYQAVVDHSRVVVDTRNATKRITRGSEKVVRA
jgi:UDP-N-acetyl-D-glucosamine dehydrogenase